MCTSLQHSEHLPHSLLFVIAAPLRLRIAQHVSAPRSEADWLPVHSARYSCPALSFQAEPAEKDGLGRTSLPWLA